MSKATSLAWSRSELPRDFIEVWVRAILTFHSIDDSGSMLSYPPNIFAKLLDALERCGIPVLDLDTLLRAETEIGVAVTFDDGIRSVFTAALPILRSHSAPAHLFLTTGVIGTTNRWPSQPASAPLFEMLRWPEIEAMCGAGMRIESHTASHPDLRQLSDDGLRAECENADEIIASRLGNRPRYFAYPYGHNNARVRDFARGRYVGSLTTDLRMLRPTEDMAALPRLDTYYLRSEFIFRDLLAPHARAYLALRKAIRHLRNAL
jgi:peptidoglycan/xylan/chitin deacetylase (PgdA/CDA1 family)